MKHVLLISLGPVQELIAAARKSRDLWFGSWVLSELSKAAAAGVVKKLGGGARAFDALVFPAPEAEGDLEPGSELCVANKLVALVDGDAALTREVAEAARAQMVVGPRAPASITPDERRRWYGVHGSERLCGVGLLKRWGVHGGAGGREQHRFSSTAHMAALPLMLGIERDAEGKPEIKEAWDGLRKAMGPAMEDLEGVPGPERRLFGRCDGAVLFSTLVREAIEERAREPKSEATRVTVEEAREALKRFFKAAGRAEPIPYYAILVGDGDSMGKHISERRLPEEHRAFSRNLDGFARDARGIVQKREGCLIYSGGDDVLAFLPLHTAIECALDLAEDFHHRTGATLSAGMAIVHYTHPLHAALDVEAAGTSIPDGYKAALERRRALLGGYRGNVEGGVTRLFTAEARGRLLVGLGTHAIRETNIALLHTWGAPYLPGSALKGVASAAAHGLSGAAPWRKVDGDAAQGEDHAALFGDTEKAGYVVFHDAWWIPEPWQTSLPLDLDVMTVHHPDYYQDGKSAPADWDEPNPVAFLTAHGKYLVALTGPEAWVKAAGDWLERGLGELGIGAKTQAGYGRMSLSRERTPEEIEQQALFEKHKARLGSLDDLAKQHKGAGTARQHIQKLREALAEGVPAAGVYAAARRLARESPRFWRDWAKELRRTEEEKAFLAESGMLSETLIGKKQ